MDDHEVAEGDDRDRIDRSSPIPLYHQLEYLIRRDIDIGRSRVGDALPSEGEICSRYGVSRSVVRQTLTNLAHAGLIRTERGRGSFVAERKLQERFVQRATGLYDDLSRMGYEIRTRVVRQNEVELPLQVQEFLQVTRGVQIDRVRSVGGRVLAFIRTYLSHERIPGLASVDLEDRSLYGVLAERFDLHVASGRRTVEAVAARGEIAEQLEVAEGEPLLLLRSGSHDEHGRPLEWFEAWHRADRTVFEIEIVPGEADRPFSSVVKPEGAMASAATPHAAPVQPLDGERVDEVVSAMRRHRVVAVLRAPTYAKPREVVEVLVENQLLIVEFTLTGDNALDAIAAAGEVEGALVGAGSVLTAKDARDAVAAGARFLIAPIDAPEVVEAAAGTPVVLAGFTPSEVWHAWTATSAPVKVFPMSVAGPDYLRALHQPMPQVPLVPSGGIDDANLGAYLDAGAVAVNVGSALCPADALAIGDLDTITARAAAIRAAVESSGHG